MSTCADVATLSLAASQTTRLQDAAGTRIECLSGSLWITQHHDRRDITLAPGERFTLDHDGVALLHAFKKSSALLVRSRPFAPGSPWWYRAGQGMLCYFMKLGMSRTEWRRAYRI